VPSLSPVVKKFVLASQLAAVLLLLSGCASTPQTSAVKKQWQESGQPSIELTEVPFFPQDQFQCGPAALATTLVYSGVEVRPQDLTEMVYVPERTGSFQPEIMAAARRHNRIPYIIEPDLFALIAQLKSGKPVLVMQNLGIEMIPRWHYAVAVGVDTHKNQIVLRSGTIERRQTPLATFENTWRRSEHWGLVLLEPGELPAQAKELDYFMAVTDFARIADKSAVKKALDTGIERWPASKPFNLALANYYYGQGNGKRAESIYRYLTTSYPDFATAHNNLASLLYEKGDLSGAKIHARKAVELGGPFVDQYRATLNNINSNDTSR